MQEVEQPELAAKLVAENVASQLERRISPTRAMKRAVQGAMRAGAQGGQGDVQRTTVWIRDGAPDVDARGSGIFADAAGRH